MSANAHFQRGDPNCNRRERHEHRGDEQIGVENLWRSPNSMPRSPTIHDQGSRRRSFNNFLRDQRSGCGRFCRWSRELTGANTHSISSMRLPSMRLPRLDDPGVKPGDQSGPHKCLKTMVGERGFELPTPWSRTRFQRLRKFVNFAVLKCFGLK